CRPPVRRPEAVLQGPRARADHRAVTVTAAPDVARVVTPPRAEPHAETRVVARDVSAGRVLPLVVLVVAGAVAGAALWAHAMWFDEVQAWNIARASRSLSALWTNLRYEGHPALWYLVLYALTRVTGDPRAMQVAEWCVMCLTFPVVLFRAPFPTWARILL